MASNLRPARFKLLALSRSTRAGVLSDTSGGRVGQAARLRRERRNQGDGCVVGWGSPSTRSISAGFGYRSGY